MVQAPLIKTIDNVIYSHRIKIVNPFSASKFFLVIGFRHGKRFIRKINFSPSICTILYHTAIKRRCFFAPIKRLIRNSIANAQAVAEFIGNRLQRIQSFPLVFIIALIVRLTDFLYHMKQAVTTNEAVFFYLQKRILRNRMPALYLAHVILSVINLFQVFLFHLAHVHVKRRRVQFGFIHLPPYSLIPAPHHSISILVLATGNFTNKIRTIVFLDTFIVLVIARVTIIGRRRDLDPGITRASIFLVIETTVIPARNFTLAVIRRTRSQQIRQRIL